MYSIKKRNEYGRKPIRDSSYAAIKRKPQSSTREQFFIT